MPVDIRLQAVTAQEMVLQAANNAAAEAQAQMAGAHQLAAVARNPAAQQVMTIPGGGLASDGCFENLLEIVRRGRVG